jgi:hypothetical protein
MDAAKLEAQEDIALATTSNQAQFTQFTGEKSPLGRPAGSVN